MPHLILEYSANVLEQPLADNLLQEMNKLLGECESFKLVDIRSRAIRHENFCVADGEGSKSFIHLQLAIMPGRSAEIKRSASEKLLKFIQQRFQRTIETTSCACSVEVRELDKESYCKSLS